MVIKPGNYLTSDIKANLKNIILLKAENYLLILYRFRAILKERKLVIQGKLYSK